MNFKLINDLLSSRDITHCECNARLLDLDLKANTNDLISHHFDRPAEIVRDGSNAEVELGTYLWQMLCYRGIGRKLTTLAINRIKELMTVVSLRDSDSRDEVVSVIKQLAGGLSDLKRTLEDAEDVVKAVGTAKVVHAGKSGYYFARYTGRTDNSTPHNAVL